MIIQAHQLLEEHTVSKRQQNQKEKVANLFGRLVHEGQYLDPVMGKLEAFLSSSQEMVSGKVFVSLHPYRFELTGIESEHDLMNATFGSYGEVNKGWSAEDEKGFIKLVSNQNKIYQHVNKEK